MSNTLQDTQKTLEVKIRPYSNQSSQERPDQKGASRVHLCREALLDLKLESGQVCYIAKVNDPDGERREAVAWLTAEKSLSKKVVQMSKAFQEACSYKLGDDVKISAGGAMDVVASIVLRDITAQDVDATSELSSQDKPHWEWFLRESLGESFLNRHSLILCSPSRTGSMREGETLKKTFEQSSVLSLTNLFWPSFAILSLLLAMANLSQVEQKLSFLV